MTLYKWKHLEMLALFLYLNNFVNVVSFVRYDPPKKWIISAEEKYTATSITEEEPFNHCTENMEVIFQDHIGWIMKL